MAAPTLTFTGQRLYDSLWSLARGIYPQVSETDTAEVVLDYPMATYLGAFAAMFDEVAELTRDLEDGTRGWAVLFDPYACPTNLLPWLAQWEGVEIPPGLPEGEERALIDEAPGQNRGTPWATIAFIQRYLTGGRTVYYNERYGGDAGLIRIRTRTSETPDPTTLLKSVVRYQKTGGLVIDYATIAGGDYLSAEAPYTTYALAEAAFSTYEQAEAQ